jgi:hypothetical protein
MKIIKQSRNILIAAGAVLVLAACDNDYEPIFNEPTDERVEQALNEYSTLINSAPYGWKAALYTEAGGGYFYYLDFQEDGNVTMVSDFNTTTAANTMSGTWVLKALQKPTLTFDTYSYIHMPADPDGNVNGGNPGEGLLSDFEFTFVRTSGDSIVMKGLKHKTELYLLKATEEETSSILGDDILHILQNTNNYIADNRGLKLQLPGNTVVPVAIDVARKLLAAQYLSADGTKIETFISPFTFSLDGIVLKTAASINGNTFRELYWNDDKGVYIAQLAAPVELVNDIEPFLFHPSVPLHRVIGQQYKRIYVPEKPEENRLPGQSDSFVEAYNEAAEGLIIGPYQLTLQEMGFTFDAANKLMYYDVIIAQTRDGATNRHLAQFVYSYTVDETGLVKFTAIGGNSNAQVIAFDLRVILQHFEDDAFKMEYIAGGFELISGFYSQKDAAYSFSGYLGNE